MRLVGVFACALVTLLRSSAARAAVATGAYGDAACFDRLTGQKIQPGLEPGGVHAVRRAFDPLTTAA